ncbi:hypothetical protein NHX12_022500 [Muraenolepis orangiensis]|uniref:RING-type E3 ubiquitin transferase n=1 Tax=Muraenolepis orangiensis TaxID=630683 RepID=A0A9Q0IUF0_9TELE|nr:hypothetical protein NHX12_022500 [Muraenolepis orangiensis]
MLVVARGSAETRRRFMGTQLARPPMQVGGRRRDATGRRFPCRFSCRFSFSAASRADPKVHPPFITPQARRASGGSMSQPPPMPPPHRYAPSSGGELLSPCRCSGSVRCSHEPCLVKWISERGSWSCEICYYKYHVVSISTKNPLQWRSISLTVIERVQIAAAVLGSLFLLASVSWLVWSSLSPNARWQRQDLLFQICYAMYGFMDLVCIVLIIHEGPSVFRIFHRWQAVNQRWKVLNYSKARDLAEQKRPDSAPRRQPPLPGPGGARTAHSPAAPPPDGLTGDSPSSSALLAAVAMAMTDPGASPDQEEEEEDDRERGEEVMEEVELEEEEVEEEEVVVVEASSSPTTGVVSGPEQSGASPGSGVNRADDGGGASYRWTYSVLHLLGQRGAPGPQARSPIPPPTLQLQGPRDPSRELVMRVTSL